MKRRPRLSLPVVAIGLLAILAAGCAPDQSAGSSPTQSTIPAPLSPTPANEPRPSGSPSPEPRPSATTAPATSESPSRTPGPAGEIRANALGKLTGNWIFVGKQVPYPHNIWAEVQIWAIPLDTGAPRLAFAYDVSLGGIPEAIFDTTPYLRRQFSPDGTRMVISVGGRLVVVDIVSGQARPLGVSGYFPAWSKDGSQIAFVDFLPFDQVVPPLEAIFVVSSAGGAVRELARVGYARQAVEWSPDGSTVIVAAQEGIALVDAGTGRVVRRLAETAAYRAFAIWRAAVPQIAIATGACDGTSTALIGLDDAAGSERTVLDTKERCPPLTVQDPRWNPASLDELLYVATRATAGAMPNEYRTHLLNVRSGRDTTLPFDAYEATWTWDGSAIAYLARAATGFYADSVRVWRRNGTGDRVLQTDKENPTFFSIASVSY